MMLAKILGSMGQTSIGKSFAVIDDIQPVIAGETNVCENIAHTYTTEFKEYFNYFWNANNGTIVEGQETNQAVVTWQGADQGELYVDVGVTNTACYKTSDPLIIEITSGPNNQIIGPDITCQGDTLYYNADYHSGNSYFWTVSSGAATLISGIIENQLKMIWTEAGASVLTLTETDLITDCPSAFDFNAFVATYPELNLGPADTIICPLDSLTLSAGNQGEQVLWSTGDTAKTIKVGTSGIGVTSKMISVVVENEYGCISSDSINVIFDFGACTGIDDYTARNYFNIFPNPVVGNTLQISSIIPIGGVSISIYDLVGSVLYFSQPPNATFTENIDVSEYPSGIYFIEFRSNTYNGAVKLVKQ
jgi:hypothetical protein